VHLIAARPGASARGQRVGGEHVEGAALDESRHFDRRQHVVRAGRDAFLGTAARAAAARQGGAEAKKMNPNALDLDEVTGLPTQRPTAPLGRA
jgi:hypothetical protein